MLNKFVRRARWLMQTLAGVKLSYDTQINTARLLNGDTKGLKCGSGCWFQEGAKILIGTSDGRPGRLSIGDGLFMNCYSIIDCHHSITIGDRVQIGPHSYIGDFDHAIEIGCDTHAVGTRLPVFIGDDVWIGAGVVVLKGITVGAGAIVGAGSVITKDVPPDTIVAGNPARILRVRATNNLKNG